MPHLSVVLVSRDPIAHALCIGELLASSLDLELVTDCAAPTDPRVIVARHDASLPLASRCNALLALAKGDCINLVVDDAIPCAGALARALGWLDRHPDHDLVHTLAARMDSSIGLACAPAPLGIADSSCAGGRDEFHALFTAPYLALSTAVFRRSLLASSGALDERPESAPCAAWDFALRLVRGRKVAFLNEPGVVLAASSDDAAAVALRRATVACRVATWRRWLLEDPSPPTLDAVDWYRMDLTLNADVEAAFGNDAARMRGYVNQLAHLRRRIGLRAERAARRELYQGLLPGPIVRAVRRPDTLAASTGLQCSVVVVCDELAGVRRLVASLFEHTPAGLIELIVIDNGSTDGTASFLSELRDRVKVITNAKNLGFARACNQGAAAATTARLMFLNNDTVALPGWLEPLLATLDEDASVGAVGSKLLYGDGTLQHAGVELIEDHTGQALLEFRHRFHRYMGHYPEAQARRELVAVTAAAVLVRNEAFEAAGRFDEAYWNGYEDMELCLRLGELGYKVVYEPRSVLIHHESATGPERWTRVGDNIRRLVSRWTGRVVPDKLLFASGCVDVRAQAEGREVEPAERVAGLYSIVLLAYNQLRYNRVCIESVLAHSEGAFELILVDNGSTDGTTEYFDALGRGDARVRVVRNAENLGFAAGCNQGVALSRGEFVVFLNNDTVVPRGWLSRLGAHLEAHPEAGAVGPISNEVSGPQRFAPIPFANEPSALPQILAFGDEVHRSAKGLGSELARLVGFCLMVRGVVLDRIGGFDPQFGIGNFEDDDLCARIREAGWINWMALDTYVHHFGSRTFLAIGPEKFAASMGRGWALFKQKWGIPAAQEPGSYRLSEMKFSTPERHYVALPDPRDALWFAAPDPFGEGVAPRALPDRSDAVFLHHSPWSEPGWVALVRSYLAAFTRDDSVTLLLWLDPMQRVTREAIEAQLAALRAEHGGGARVEVVADFLSRSELASLYRAVDCVVSAGDPVLVERAARVGVRARVNPTAEVWREAARVR